MRQADARNVHQGDTVTYRGNDYTVASIRTTGIASPHFRLNSQGDYPDENLTSYVLITGHRAAEPNAEGG